jgi:hypothetical protein
VKLYTVTAVTDDAVVIKELETADAETPLLIFNGSDSSTVQLRQSRYAATKGMTVRRNKIVINKK